MLVLLNQFTSFQHYGVAGVPRRTGQHRALSLSREELVPLRAFCGDISGYLAKGIQTPMVRGRSTESSRIRTSRLSMKDSLSLNTYPRTPNQGFHDGPGSTEPSPFPAKNPSQEAQSLLTTYWSESTLSS